MARKSKRQQETELTLLWAEGYNPGDEVPKYPAEMAEIEAKHVLKLIDEWRATDG